MKFEDFVEWWQSMPAWIRYLVPIAIIAGGAYWFANPIPGFRHSSGMFALIFLIGIGLLLLGTFDP